MPSYRTVTYQCQKFADLLRNKESKDRLKATCFSSSPTAQSLFHGISKFTLHVHRERFGTVAAVVRDLPVLRPALERGWSLAKFNGNGFEDFGFQELDLAGAIAAEDHDQHDSRLDVVNGAVWSRFFWGYLVGISGLASVLLLAIHWSESCPCHWPQLRSQPDPADADAVKAFKAWEKCPFRCRRCPELATGDLLWEIREALAAEASSIALKLPSDLSKEERKTILTEVESGKNHLMFYFQLKLHYFTKPPWSIFGVGHPDPARALHAAELLLSPAVITL